LALFSLSVCAAGLGGLNDEYVPPPPVKPRPQVVERVVEKSVKDPAAEKRAQSAETEIARLKAELDKAHRLTDPASACLKNGAWEAACGFAAYAGGPVFRVVGGDLRFMMGTAKGADSMADDNEGPPHPVSFQRRYALAETEVTVAQYLACVEDGGCKEPEWREAGSEYHYQTGSDTWYRSVNAHQPTSPITGVSWKDAKAYVAWLSRKSGQTITLPTEAQWEYAARGGQSRRWYFGDDESQLKDHAWYGANSGKTLHPVGSTRLTTHPWGLKDMAGNAWEWVEDCSHGSYVNAPANGDKAWEGSNGGDCGYRVRRGGAWVNDAWCTRAANRGRCSTVSRIDFVSFRPARLLP
jgi:formylglycine-generating enzyme required for sulfatase activity